MTDITRCGKQKLLLIALLHLTYCSFSQNNDSTKHVVNFKTAVSVTNNGFSFIPSFSLGKPAAIINLSIGGKKFSFEPELRFSLEGKPWSFIFIWRYKFIATNKFQFTVGAHVPALAYRTVLVEKNGATQDLIQTQRFLAYELIPNYNFTKNISIGLFYLYAHGIEEDAAKNTHFISLRSNFSNIKLSNQYYLKFNPQVFYLNSDKKEGFYASSGLTLAKQHFPLSISTTVNKPLKTNIAGKIFDWNVSLIYSLSKNFVRQQPTTVLK
jgi:hypothetical protein